jgi:hypothetical protein
VSQIAGSERRLDGSSKRPAVSSDQWIGAKHESPESQRFVGLGQAEAIELAHQTGFTVIRVLDFERSADTTDFTPDRLDLLVRNGVVIRAAFF